ncbi:MAG: DUF368 domain-containing protein [Methanomicrobium sp.]|nr:DUF368 domain-containing protein [Methanomicrobium sp.]
MDKTVSEYLLILVRGFLMGACDIIPGVSGGTIALLTGIYERLVTAIGNIRPDVLLKTFFTDRKAFVAELKYMDFFFLVILVSGIVIAAVTVSKIISMLLESYTAFTYSFFFGLILASAVLILLEIGSVESRGNKIAVVGSALVGLVIGYLVGGLEPAMLGHSPLVLFITGMVAFCAMILPGISGAYITLIFNQYEYLLNCIHTMEIVPLIVFSAGGILGILGFTKLLKFLLSRYHAAMLAMLTGLMIGTSRLLIGKVELSGGFTPAVIVCALAGVALLVILEFVKRNCISKEQTSQ